MPRNVGYVKQSFFRLGHTWFVTDSNSNGKPPASQNRRRASQIVHDDRGNARVEWIDAGYAGVPLERAPLAIEPTPARGDHAKLSVERTRAKGFDPYARVGNGPTPDAKKQPEIGRASCRERVLPTV